MKKKILLSIPTLLLCLISAFIFLIGIYGSGWNRTYVLTAFLISIVLNLIYYFWLYKTKKITGKIISFYIPIAFVFFVFFIFAIIYRFWIVREIYIDMGPDPFVPETNITSGMHVGIWQKEYWFKSAQADYRLRHLKEMQITRQGSLIGHIGTDLQGWTAEEIKYAFYEPSKVIKIAANLEKWIYHPWTNHTDWEMPVYVQDGLLLKIGD